MREQVVTELYKLNRTGKCRCCGTNLPLSDIILQKFQRCYYCGQHKPFGSNWKSLIAPAFAITVFAALTMWWKQTFS